MAGWAQACAAEEREMWAEAYIGEESAGENEGCVGLLPIWAARPAGLDLRRLHTEGEKRTKM